MIKTHIYILHVINLEGILSFSYLSHLLLIQKANTRKNQSKSIQISFCCVSCAVLIERKGIMDVLSCLVFRIFVLFVKHGTALHSCFSFCQSYYSSGLLTFTIVKRRERWFETFVQRERFNHRELWRGEKCSVAK